MIRGIILIVLFLIWFLAITWPTLKMQWEFKNKTKKEKMDDFNKELDRFVKEHKK